MKSDQFDVKTMKQINKAVECVVAWLTHFRRAHKATKYLSPRLTVKATRQHKSDRRDPQETYLLTIGAPNYLERRFITACEKAGEKFPVKRVQMKWAK